MIKQDYLTIHEHEKIVNERIDYCHKQKSIEIESLSEKFEQEMRHLKETFSLKANSERTKYKTKTKELTEKIEMLSKY